MKKIILKLFIFIFLIEVLLRLTGWMYYSFHTYRLFKNTKGRIKILCLGESTTFGTGANKGEDYPSQLHDLLEKAYPGKFLVYNKGVPGMTSSQLLLNLKGFMKETRPHLVILLCGTNEYNLRSNVLNSFIILQNKNQFINNVIFNLSKFLSGLRTYRLVILLTDHLRYKIVKYRGAYIAERSSYDLSGAQIKDKQTVDLLTKQYRFNIDKITKFVRNQSAEVIYTTYLKGVMYNEIKNSAARNRVILCDQVEMLKQEGLSLSGFIISDGVHPNAEGYKLMARFLLDTIENSKDQLGRFMR